jgi:MoCo/4Fe-4S cofactor protein with predicted Tat translocation signal
MGEEVFKILREATCPGHQPAEAPTRQDFDEAREKLASADGPEFWRSLEELAGSREFQEQLHREFPKGASEWLDPVSRRGFLRLMGASMALAGLTGCTKQPLEPIVPYVRQPEELIPGRPLYFATAMTLGGYGKALLVESHEGRPTKIEGNPEHAASLGATDVFAQASLLDLYDPDRSPSVLFEGEIRPFSSFLAAMQAPIAAQQSGGGAGMRILTQTVSSPTVADQLSSLLRAFPQAKWHQYEAVNRDSARAGAELAFGRAVEAQYRLADADVILSLDADFLYGGFPGFEPYAREFGNRRDPDASAMNRMYMVESSTTATGGNADHRLPLSTAQVEQFARAVAGKLGIEAGAGALSGAAGKFMDAVVADLQQHRGRSLVIAGDQAAPVVHALAHAINDALGNAGKTVVYTDPVAASWTDQTQSLRELAADMAAGKVEFLLILGGNPAYDAPADLNFADTLKKKVPLRVHLGLYANETAELCHWHINEAHYLEAWGDARAWDGSVLLTQPLIAPLYDGKSVSEVLAVFLGQGQSSGYEILRAYWQRHAAGKAESGLPQRTAALPAVAGAQPQVSEFEKFWRKSVHDGFIAGSAYAPLQVRAKAGAIHRPAEAGDNSIELTFHRDPSIYDGRFANNGWLQELPKPMTKVTWDNPLLVSPKLAMRLGLKTEDVVELEVQGRKARAAVWIQAGQPENSVTAFLGYGRAKAGRAGTGAGFNMYALRSSAQPWSISGVQLRKTGATYKLASTQGQQTMDTSLGPRPAVITGTIAAYKSDPEFVKGPAQSPAEEETLNPAYEYTGYKWGMSIDLNRCVGCNACIVACQSENNIPVVGKEQVVRGRHMHWLRVDTYYQGDRDNPRIFYEPVPCMHCENAPCEYVCPVGATVHSSEGLNDMVYNRCVGTRYCQNNCPYKVRRFNFLLFQDWNTPQLKMMRNPDVSVRSRGVMEKCTYCVQRINEKRIDSEREDRKIRDQEIQTACQQACPSRAIIFGDLNNGQAQVAELKKRPRDYGLLADLNTRPRTSYLARITNPNSQAEQV